MEQQTDDSIVGRWRYFSNDSVNVGLLQYYDTTLTVPEGWVELETEPEEYTVIYPTREGLFKATLKPVESE